MSISVRPRDLVFNFNDSCNCCVSCFTRKRKVKRVYVTTKGELERFKLKKTKGKETLAFQRAVKNLNSTLERRVNSFDGEPELFQIKISNIFDSISALGEINMSHIETINTLMLEFFEEFAK